MQFSRLISYLLHPLFMPFYAMVLVLNLNTYVAFSTSPHVQQVLITVVFITTAALPIITTLFMLQRGVVSSLEMENPSERKWPFVTTAFCYFVCHYLISQLPIPVVMSDMVLGAAVAIILSWIVNFFWKISIHMVGIGGLVGLLIGFSSRLNAGLHEAVILVVLLAGLLGFARLATGAHTQAQVYSGFCLGLICEWAYVGG